MISQICLLAYAIVFWCVWSYVEFKLGHERNIFALIGQQEEQEQVEQENIIN